MYVDAEILIYFTKSSKKYYAKYEGIVGDSVSNSVMQKIATYKKKINVGNL